MDDLREQDADDYGRWVILFGVDSEKVQTLITPVGLGAALEDYVVHERGPIRIVVMQVSDIEHEYVFVPHEPIEPVIRLLESWGIGPDAPHKTRHYRELHTAKLETLLERSSR